MARKCGHVYFFDNYQVCSYAFIKGENSFFHSLEDTNAISNWTKSYLFPLQSFLVSGISLKSCLSFVLNLNFKLYHYASLLRRRENDWQVDVTVISSLNLKLMIIYCKEALTTDSTSPCSFSEKKDYEVIICKLLSLLKSCSKLQNRRAFKCLFRTGEVL